MSFIKTIYDKELSDLRENQKDPKCRLQNIAWPSESLAQLGPIAVGECKRALFYKIIGLPYSEQMDIRGRRICDNGITSEDYIINKFKTSNMLVNDQKRIEFTIPNSPHKIKISGKVDAIISDDSKNKAIEIKSVAGFGVAKIFGFQNNDPLPRSSHLMQALLYKYYSQHTTDGKEDSISDTYLLYVDRGTHSRIYFKVDFDKQMYPIITSISEKGDIIQTIKTQEYPSYNNFKDGLETATPKLSRIAELRINVNKIFEKFNSVYTNVSQKVLPEKDYKIIYSQDDLEIQYLCGRLGKQQYTKAKKGKAEYGDNRCGFCSYRSRCLSDSGINI